MSYSLVNKNNTGMGFWFFVAQVLKKEENGVLQTKLHRHFKKGIPSLLLDILGCQGSRCEKKKLPRTVAARVPRCNESYSCF